MNSLIALRELPDAPSEFQLLPYGQIELEGDEPAVLDNEGMDQIINHFEGRSNDMVIDYEHQTLKSVEAPAAGWIKKLINRGEQGLWAAVEWTEKATKYLLKREYRYFSPVFMVRKSDRKVVQVKNAALTNSPQINHLTPIMAKLDQPGIGLIRLDGVTLSIAKMMGNTEEDLIRHGGQASGPDYDEVDERSLLQVAKMMGNTEEDVIKYGGQGSGPDSDEVDERSLLQVAKMMGNTEEDVIKYGGRASGPDSDEVDERALLEVAKLMGNTEEDLIRHGGQASGPNSDDDEEVDERALLQVAKMMGVSQEDIERHGDISSK